MTKIHILKTFVNVKWITEAGVVEHHQGDEVIKELSNQAIVYLVHLSIGNTGDS